MRSIVFIVNSPSFAFFYLVLVITIPKRKVNTEKSASMIVLVSFVSAILGTTPKVKISSPKDISGSIGRITMDMFDEFKEELAEYVREYSNSEFFHFDEKNDYLFEGRAWEHGHLHLWEKGKGKGQQCKGY